MRALPKGRDEWIALALFPFKVYSVIGICAFGLWHFGQYYCGWGTWHFYDEVVGCILTGYMASVPILLCGGLIQWFALKSAAASSTIVFSIVDFGVVMILPIFLHA